MLRESEAVVNAAKWPVRNVIIPSAIQAILGGRLTSGKLLSLQHWRQAYERINGCQRA